MGVPTSSTPSERNLNDWGSSERRMVITSSEQVEVYRVALSILIDSPQLARMSPISFQNVSERADGSAIMLMSSRRPNAIPLETLQVEEVSNALIFFMTGLWIARQKRNDPKVHPCLTPSSLERVKKDVPSSDLVQSWLKLPYRQFNQASIQ